MKLLMELWREYNGDVPSDADFADEAREEEKAKIYMEALLPRAKEIILKLVGSTGEDFAAELAHAAEGNNRVDVLEFLLESIGEDIEDLTDPDRYGDM